MVAAPRCQDSTSCSGRWAGRSEQAWRLPGSLGRTLQRHWRAMAGACSQGGRRCRFLESSKLQQAAGQSALQRGLGCACASSRAAGQLHGTHRDDVCGVHAQVFAQLLHALRLYRAGVLVCDAQGVGEGGGGGCARCCAQAAEAARGQPGQGRQHKRYCSGICLPGCAAAACRLTLQGGGSGGRLPWGHAGAGRTFVGFKQRVQCARVHARRLGCVPAPVEHIDGCLHHPAGRLQALCRYFVAAVGAARHVVTGQLRGPPPAQAGGAQGAKPDPLPVAPVLALAHTDSRAVADGAHLGHLVLLRARQAVLRRAVPGAARCSGMAQGGRAWPRRAHSSQAAAGVPARASPLHRARSGVGSSVARTQAHDPARLNQK